MSDNADRARKFGMEAWAQLQAAWDEEFRLRARVAELEGAGNALADKAQETLIALSGVPEMGSPRQMLGARIDAWRSAAGTPTTDTGSV